MKGKIDPAINIEEKQFKQSLQEKPAYVDLVDGMTKKRMKEFRKGVLKRYLELKDLIEYIDSKL